MNATAPATYSIYELPPLPSPSLDPVLDAASRCFARYGVRRTSVQDVARELGVNRTTVYRQVGTIEQQALLIAARDTHRMFAKLPSMVSWPVGPRSVIEMVATIVRESMAHPVLAKILADERDMIGSFVASDSHTLIDRGTTAIVPLIALAMEAGNLAKRDPVLTSQWILRIAATLILTPPPGDLEDFLAEFLLPALTP